MACSSSSCSFLVFLVTFLVFTSSSTSSFGTAKPRKLIPVRRQPLVLKFHNGSLLKGDYTVNLIWYGSFSPSQRAVVSDFVRSLSPDCDESSSSNTSSAASWWGTTEKYATGSGDGTRSTARISLGRNDYRRHSTYRYHLGKSLTHSDILALAAAAAPRPHRNAINVVLTSSNVAVDGFCTSKCGTHGSAPARGKHGRSKFPYIWVGDSATQCPGQCAWPFHRPIYGPPQTAALVPPNLDAGVDGMVINLAALLAGTVTNPFQGGYFQGPRDAPLEAATACSGAFGKGAYPGYPGVLLVDGDTGGSYNAVGLHGRKYLLPALWDPSTLRCSTPV